MKSERFIPYSKNELAAKLTERFSVQSEKDEFSKFCHIIGSVYHYRFHRVLEEFKMSYLPIDPDKPTALKQSYSESQLVQFEKSALTSIEEVLVAGNYNKVSPVQLEEAFGKASPWGLDLKVDTEKYDLLSLYYRGEHADEMDKKVLFVNKHFDFSVYDRVVLVFKLKETAKEKANEMHQFEKGKLYLKLFKNVPTVDLEMLFPDTKIVIRSIDQARVIVPLAAGTATTIYKIATYIVRQGDPVRLWSQISFWVLVGGLFGIALKAFFGYKNTVQKYLKNLTTSLYFQNLDNNSGVFKNILDDAEEEECKELILAYYFLLTEKFQNPSLEKLDARIEEFFRTELKVEIDFEVEDAFRKLQELGLLSNEKELKAIPVNAALRKLDKMWDDFVNA